MPSANARPASMEAIHVLVEAEQQVAFGLVVAVGDHLPGHGAGAALGALTGGSAALKPVVRGGLVAVQAGQPSPVELDPRLLACLQHVEVAGEAFRS